MQEALTALLLGDAGLTAQVGDRVHWMRRPATVTGRPYLNLQVVSDPRLYHSKGTADLRRTRVQADIWGDTYATVTEAGRAFTDLVSAFRGAVLGVEFQVISVDSERDLAGETVEAETQLFRRSIDLLISWKKGA